MAAIRFRGSGWTAVVEGKELPLLVERLRLTADAWALSHQIEQRLASGGDFARELTLTKSDKRALLSCVRMMQSSGRIKVSPALRRLGAALEEDLSAYET